MADYITKIRTEDGDKQIDYSALANLPQPDDTLTKSGKFADAKATGDAIKKISDKLTPDNITSLVTPDGIGAAVEGHNHTLDNLDGTLSVENGGTGASTAEEARTNLGITPENIGASAAVHSHSIAELSDTLSVDKGGTGATTAEEARTNLGITPENIGAAAVFHSHTADTLGGTLSIIKGGTGATTADGAIRNLFIVQDDTPTDVVDGAWYLIKQAQ